MESIDHKPYHSLNHYYHHLFGQKAYKIALDIGSTCPNRDGSLGTDGCIFCSPLGSGDYAAKNTTNLNDQISQAIEHLRPKYTGNTFIAYLQSFSNTYGDTAVLLNTYETILNHPAIKGLSIATRPDCLEPSLLEGLSHLAKKYPLWLELGLQTIHNESANRIRRGYALDVFDQAVDDLYRLGLPIVVHLIAGLPGETNETFLESVRYLAKLPLQGVKFHLLHVLKDTDLGEQYLKQPFDLPTLDAYCHLIVKAITLLPETMVIHRLTGDAPKEKLIAPLWSLNKRKVLNTIHQLFREEDVWQGKFYER